MDETLTLDHFLKFGNGKTSPERFDSGRFPVFGANGIIGYSDSFNTQGPCIILGRVGNFCGSVHLSETNCWVTDNAISAVPINDESAVFWFAFLKNTNLRSLAHGSGQPLITQKIIKSITAPKFTASEKTGIADALGSLDDKIATNNKIIGYSSALLGVQYRRATKAESLLTLGEVAQVFGGSTPSTKVEEYWDGDIQWATPTDITALNGPWISTTARTITDAGLKSMSSGIHPENSILMTSRATIGAIALAARPIATNQGFIVVEASDELTPWLYAQMLDRKHEFESWANGATFMELSRGNFKKLPFYSCEDSALAEFNSIAWPLLDRMKAAQAENETLARTRDELLPLLMSGRITVAGASKSGVGSGVAGLLEGMS